MRVSDQQKSKVRVVSRKLREMVTAGTITNMNFLDRFPKNFSLILSINLMKISQNHTTASKQRADQSDFGMLFFPKQPKKPSRVRITLQAVMTCPLRRNVFVCSLLVFDSQSRVLLMATDRGF